MMRLGFLAASFRIFGSSKWRIHEARRVVSNNVMASNGLCDVHVLARLYQVVEVEDLQPRGPGVHVARLLIRPDRSTLEIGEFAVLVGGDNDALAERIDGAASAKQAAVAILGHHARSLQTGHFLSSL